jgi:hypothetical protein
MINLDREFNENEIVLDLESSIVNKPIMAMWSSTLYSCGVDKYSSNWLDWCKIEMPKWAKGYKYVFIPKSDLKIYEIDTVEDYLSTKLKKTLDGKIDYKNMKKHGYHAIHFTHRGAMLGHGGTRDFELMMLLNGFDVESTVYLVNDWYKEYRLIGKN